MADSEQTIPTADRPWIPGYGIPETAEGMLSWSWAQERLDAALNYWVGTTRPDGRPHAAPVWGVWLDNCFYFEGSPLTRRGRNLGSNPAVTVHLENAEEVVILEGTATEITAVDPALAAQLVAAYAHKYKSTKDYEADPKNWEGGGLYAIPPDTVIAWAAFPTTATRWHFRRP